MCVYMYADLSVWKNTCRDTQQIISSDYFWRTGLVGKIGVRDFIVYLVNLYYLQGQVSFL